MFVKFEASTVAPDIDTKLERTKIDKGKYLLVDIKQFCDMSTEGILLSFIIQLFSYNILLLIH